MSLTPLPSNYNGAARARPLKLTSSHYFDALGPHIKGLQAKYQVIEWGSDDMFMSNRWLRLHKGSQHL